MPLMACRYCDATFEASLRAIVTGALRICPACCEAAPPNVRFLPAPLVEALDPWASYRPAEPTPRKVRESRACPHCGEVHPLRRTDACTGCGVIVAEGLVTPPIVSYAERARRYLEAPQSEPRITTTPYERNERNEKRGDTA